MSFKPTRRDLIAGGVGAGMALPLVGNSLAPRWLHAAGASYKKLVVIKLNGGNDWINNIVNPDEPTYNRARPTVRLQKSQMIRLDNSLPYYIHPGLKSFKALYDAGMIAMLPGIGYAKPNLSHFRSMDIWAEADPDARTVKSGWLGDFFNVLYQGNDPIEGLDLERRLDRFLQGHPVPLLRNPATFQYRTDRYTPVDNRVELALLESNAKVLRSTPNANLKFLADSLARVPADSRLLLQTGSNYSPKATYPNRNTRDTQLRVPLQLAARYITGGLSTPVYMLSLGGWDTHANQVMQNNVLAGRHADLLGSIGDNVKAFLDDLKAHGKDKDVLVMLVSEFGRRVGENGNLGTDHGAAGIAYVMGQPVKKAGLLTPFPSWASVRAPYNRANFQYTVDFRRLYATILDDYWGVDSTKILGKKYASLGIV